MIRRFLIHCVLLLTALPLLAQPASARVLMECPDGKPCRYTATASDQCPKCPQSQDCEDESAKPHCIIKSQPKPTRTAFPTTPQATTLSAVALPCRTSVPPAFRPTISDDVSQAVLHPRLIPQNIQRPRPPPTG